MGGVAADDETGITVTKRIVFIDRGSRPTGFEVIYQSVTVPVVRARSARLCRVIQETTGAAFALFRLE